MTLSYLERRDARSSNFSAISVRMPVEFDQQKSNLKQRTGVFHESAMLPIKVDWAPELSKFWYI